jgi:hypothetical protein
MLGLLYDITATFRRSTACSSSAEAEGVDRWLLGGDYGTPSPWPLETLDRLKQLPNATWIAATASAGCASPHWTRPEVMESYAVFTGGLPDEVVDWLYGLPPQADLDGVLYVHGSRSPTWRASRPSRNRARSDAGRRPRPARRLRPQPQQFRRPGPDGTELLNPGSVGMPLGRRHALRLGRAHRRRRVRVRRTEYDVQRAADAYRELGGDFGEFAARRIERGSD